MTGGIVINDPHALKWAVIGWLTKPGTTVFWSTHDHEGVSLAFDAIWKELLGNPGVSLPFQSSKQANGSEEIRLSNRSRILFRSRRSLAHRGVAADKLIIEHADEASAEQIGLLLSMIAAVKGVVVYSG